jgi:hypothetical protein
MPRRRANRVWEARKERSLTIRCSEPRPAPMRSFRVISSSSLRLVRPMTRALFAIALILSIAAVSAETESRDGTWWIHRREAIRIFYVIGMLDGVEAAVEAVAPNNAPSDIAERLSSTVNKRIGNAKAGQIKEGLDAFYKDSRNQHIPVGRAFWLVLASRSGMPEAEFMQMVEKARAASH